MHMPTRIHTFARTTNAQQPRGAQTHTYRFWQSQKPFKRMTEKNERARINEGRCEKKTIHKYNNNNRCDYNDHKFCVIFFSLEFYFLSCLFSVWSSTLKESDDMIFINVISEFQRMCSFSFDKIIRSILNLSIVYISNRVFRSIYSLEISQSGTMNIFLNFESKDTFNLTHQCLMW